MEKDPKLMTILQFGDYNFPFISWPSKAIYKGNQVNRQVKSGEKEQAEYFLNYMEENFLENFCLAPTRQQNILDLVLANNPGLIGPIFTIISKGISDHNLIEVSINHPYTQPQKPSSRQVPYTTKFHQYEINKADQEDWLRYEAELMEVDFDSLTESMNVKQRMDKFCEILEKATAAVFIKKKEFVVNEEEEKEEIGEKKTKNKIPKEVRLLLRQKKEISDRIKKSNHWYRTLILTRELEEKEALLCEKYKARKLKVEKEAIDKIKVNPKYFYRFARKSAKSSNEVGTLMDAEGNLCSDDFDKTECLRKQYESVYTKPDERYVVDDKDNFFNIGQSSSMSCVQCKLQVTHMCSEDSAENGGEEPEGAEGVQGRLGSHMGEITQGGESGHMEGVLHEEETDRIQPPIRDQLDNSEEALRRRNPANPRLTELFFDHMEVFDAINKIPNEASPGPDGVPPCLLKKGGTSIALMLHNILKSSFESGEIPDILKLGLISPIHKGGSTSDSANFRPVSLTSHIAKTGERTIREKLVNYLEYINKMDGCQHGSRRGRSTLSQLLEHHHEIIQMLERGENVDSIYLDFAKAFDKCDIGILMHKLKALGVTGKLGKWIFNFLSQRKQQVVINGVASNVTNVTSGVPQGTVLGPILFLIYISDIGDNITSSKKIYVDDTKIKKGIRNESDVEELQEDLDKLYSWAKENNMVFNGTKFQLMRYGSDEEIKNDTNYFTGETTDIIERFENLRDLGVILSDDASFDDHILKVAKKVRQKIGWVMRTFYSRRQDLMKTLFKSLIVPHVDYCSQLWMPIKSTSIQTIEKLQKDFFNKIPVIRELNIGNSWQV